MDTNDSSNPLRKFTTEITRKPPYPSLVKPTASPKPESDDEDESEVSGYRALIEHREKKGNAPRFRIITRAGQSYGCGYAYLLGWLHTPPDSLTIYTTTHIFGMSGKNLHRIENALMRDKVKQLCEFNREKDQPPADGEPFIEHLEVTSRFEQS